MVTDTSNQETKKILDRADLEQHVIEMIKKARVLKNQNYNGSIQERVFADLRHYLEEHTS